MKTTKHGLLLLLLIGCFLLPAPRAQAFLDPVTIAILAPIALKVADTAKPYVIRGLTAAGKQLIQMGIDTFGILRLPWGLVQSTIGAPLGGFQPGLVNIFKGLIAPVRLVWDTLLLPLALFGVQVN